MQKEIQKLTRKSRQKTERAANTVRGKSRSLKRRKTPTDIDASALIKSIDALSARLRVAFDTLKAAEKARYGDPSAELDAYAAHSDVLQVLVPALEAAAAKAAGRETWDDLAEARVAGLL